MPGPDPRALRTRPDAMSPGQAAPAPAPEDPVTAWRRLTGAAERILDTQRLKRNNRTQVHRLELRAPAQSVIAKRCRARAALLEHAVYTEILDRRRLRAPALYGFGPDPFTDDGHAYYWLFMEDLGPRRHDPSSEAERRGLAQWLGTLGALTAATSQTYGAPDRRLPYYGAFLGDAADGLLRLTRQRTVSPSVRELIDDVVRAVGRVEAGWARLESLADDAPSVIAHGDCLPKNIHVTGDAVVPIDWGSVGVGLPGADLGVSSVWFDQAREVDPCVEAYAATIRPAWPDVSAAVVRRLALAGRVLWALKLVAQSVPGFEFYATAKVETNLRLYSSLLRRSTEELLVE